MALIVTRTLEAHSFSVNFPPLNSPHVNTCFYNDSSASHFPPTFCTFKPRKNQTQVSQFFTCHLLRSSSLCPDDKYYSSYRLFRKSQERYQQWEYMTQQPACTLCQNNRIVCSFQPRHVTPSNRSFKNTNNFRFCRSKTAKMHLKLLKVHISSKTWMERSLQSVTI